MKITENSLKRNKYIREVRESETHNDWYACTWTKLISDETGKKYTIEITEYDIGKLEQFGFPKYNCKASFFRKDYRESFTVSYSGDSESTKLKDIENFFDEVWIKMSCQYDYED
ncbi:hypothetical protein [Bacillus sp. FJAT-29814]|uniref:hypothetical protein n=1 Tax=Bacillus sp. FJAT-29814 TaxID=1729688 RepID=UPI00082A765B|nr:hypothetical protein [Bacillus sp. FJAT-29814]